jgi:tRNA-modifying protein YgfZ
MPSAQLTDRGLIQISGPEAYQFLQGLVTADLQGLTISRALFSALLSPQGKVLVDFFIIQHGSAPNDALIDVARSHSALLMQKLNMYRLRAKVSIADVSAQWKIGAIWGADEHLARTYQAWADPRSPHLGWRVISPVDMPLTLGQDDYHAHCIASGVPTGGIDFVYGDIFPHDANMDLLHGIAFNKGCYIGQEVVTRVEHRGSARKRFVRISFDGQDMPAGTDISDGERVLGTITSAYSRHGLALMRLDHLDEALNAKRHISANHISLQIERP